MYDDSVADFARITVIATGLTDEINTTNTSSQFGKLFGNNSKPQAQASPIPQFKMPSSAGLDAAGANMLRNNR